MFDNTPSTENFPNLYPHRALNRVNTVYIVYIYILLVILLVKKGYGLVSARSQPYHKEDNKFIISFFFKLKKIYKKNYHFLIYFQFFFFVFKFFHFF